MRISQIMLAKGFGGAERSFVDTALSLVERGHQVQAICHKRFSKIALLKGLPGVRLETISAGAEWDFVTPFRIAANLRSFRAEIVHTQLKRAAWHGGRAGAIAGIPVVAKLHNYVDLKKYRHVHTLLCTTRDQQSYVLNQGWPEERVRIVPNFSRVQSVDAIRTAPGSPIRILSYGRYVKKKGFDLLLHAFRQLLDSGVDAELTIGGSGEELAVLESLVEELKLRDVVKLGTWISDVAAALDKADLFVLPSLDEPFGIVMLEAMARGVPIISTRTKGPGEVLDENTAQLVEIGSAEAIADAMKEFASSPGQSHRRAAKALEHYQQNYCKNAVLPKIEAIYKHVINGQCFEEKNI